MKLLLLVFRSKHLNIIISYKEMAGEDYGYSEKTSEFNEAKFQIYRLHNLWLECKMRRQNGDLVGLRYALDSVALELNTDAVRVDKNKKVEEDKCTYKLEKIDLQIRKEIEMKTKESLLNLYELLKQKEKILRQLQEESGKGTRLTHREDRM